MQDYFPDSTVRPHPIVQPAPVGGIVGPQGPPGPEGPEGPRGEAGGESYVHQQPLPSDTWVIAHGLGRYPSVTVVDSSNRTVDGSVVYDSMAQITISFTAPFAGCAYLN